MKLFGKLILSFFVFASATSFSFAGKEIKMVYKEGGKLPLIAKMPDNTGAYMELFSKAAKKIGCTIKVSRMPKKRLHYKLEKGELDFYPGASFSTKRAKYLYYIENGFMTGDYGITSVNTSDIFDYQQIKEFDLTWLMELGSSKLELANEIGTKTQSVYHADIELARKLVTNGRKIFYIADKELVDYYLKKKGVASFREAGLKVHPNCCEGDMPMHMGFSRLSPLFKEKANPEYDATRKLSPANFPTIVDPECVAAKLGQALKEMKADGETDKIYKKYFSRVAHSKTVIYGVKIPGVHEENKSGIYDKFIDRILLKPDLATFILLPPARAVKEFSNCKNCCLTPMNPSKDLKDKLKFGNDVIYTDTIGFSKMFIFTGKDKKVISKLSDLKGKTVGVRYGFYYGEAFEKAELIIDSTAYSIAKNITKLDQGRIDAFVAYVPDAYDAFKSLGKDPYPHDKNNALVVYKDCMVCRDVPKEFIETFNKGLKQK